jgi:uncharacterized protein (DUF58 family)
MLIPSKMHCAIWLGLTATGCLVSVVPEMAFLWRMLAGLAVGGALLDGLFSLRRPVLTIERTVHHNLPVSAWSRISLKIVNFGGHSLVLQLHDRCDADFQVRHQPCSIILPPKGKVCVNYEVYPTRRGQFTFSGTDAFIGSPLRLWQKKWFLPCLSETKVFPNFRKIRHYALLATHHNLSMMGIKKLTRRGEGNDFHQLREYRQGDSLQKIDWKATSRYRRLIAKEYQDERDQQIIFVLDCGRRMHHAEAGKSHLDQALSSVLLLAHVAARQGDGVGFYSFGGTRKWVPPRKTEDSVRTLLLAMYDVESSTNASDYLLATHDLLALQTRRALMVIITGSRAEDHDDLLRMTSRLRRKHLLVVADLREKILDETMQTPVTDFSQALRYQALQHYLGERDVLLKQLRHHGIHTLDVTAEQLPPALVNSYLEIKSEGSL